MIDEISKKIRQVRKEKNMTLKELSERTGLSVSFLSQVENNATSLAITSLKKIADALEKDISYFFKSPEVKSYHVKYEDQEPFKFETSKAEFVKLSGNFPNRIMEAMIVTMPPKEQHGDFFSHPGEEFIYVLNRTLEIVLDDVTYLVKQGDSFHFPSTMNHLWRNPLKSTLRFLLVITPPLF